MSSQANASVPSQQNPIPSTTTHSSPTNTMTDDFEMPNVHHPSAPKFDGRSVSLSSYLDEVEQLARNNNLSIQQTIQWSIRYLRPEEQQLWKALPSSKGNDWTTFKKELFECYPGAEEKCRYTISTLEALVEKQSELRITDSEQFGIYFRSFYAISAYLQDQKKLNEREIGRFFIQGLHPSFRKQIRDQLHAEDPTHHPDDPFSLAEIRSAALFILSCHQGSQSSSPISSPTISSPEEPTKPSFSINSLVDEIMKRVEPLLQRKIVSEHDHSNPCHPSKFMGCAFCSDESHYIPNCDIAEAYIQQGFCSRNSENRIILPNGELVTYQTAPGKNLQDRIDNWHKSNRPNVPVVSSNLTIVAEAPSFPAKQIPIDAEKIYKVTELAPAGITNEEHLRLLEEFLEFTQRKTDDIRRKLSTQASDLRANSPIQSHPHPEIVDPTTKLESQAPRTTVRHLSITSAKAVSPHNFDVNLPINAPASPISLFKTKEGSTLNKQLNTRTKLLGRSTKESFLCRIASPERFSLTDARSASSVFCKDDPGIKFALKHCSRRPNIQDFGRNLICQ
ncbi:hypothetical protein CVT26_011323 [Gymnopilus dilepis]|uniref:Retrotransposon gag domain-containing protein n=1 Tax=Gymnopilus dilepis TaxID=231916 RepID=A0A409YR10_9AGAR|nr:hypothetical protein CVT26_011323 [Gymnopilus dilepis]